MKLETSGETKARICKLTDAAAILICALPGPANATTITLTLDGNWANYHQYTDSGGLARLAWTGGYLATLVSDFESNRINWLANSARSFSKSDA